MAPVTNVASGLGFPEGPVVLEDGSVIVCELRGDCITRIRPDGSKHLVAKIKGSPGGLAVGPDGALYCCNNGGFSWQSGVGFPVGAAADYHTGSIDRIDISTGKVERVYDACDGAALAGPNDIVFDTHGGFWFTDTGKETESCLRYGGLYYAKVDGSEIRRIVSGLRLNGVGLSPDGSVVYAAASFTRHLLAFEAGPAASYQGHDFLAGEIVYDYPGRRILDSMAIEADGTIAQAIGFDGPGISRLNPRTREEVTVPFADILATNIAFGGRDMRTAYVTLATTGLLVKVDWPAAGLKLAFNL